MRARRKVTRRGRGQRGNAMLELALCFMGFLMLTLGTMEFAWGVYAYNFCAYAAQDAARYASVNGSLSTSPATQASISSFVQNEAVGLNTSNLTTTASWANNSNVAGSTVTVTVNYVIVPLVGLALKQNLTVSSTADYVINH
jgi:Flp pilus assembly protein TadG